MNSPDRSLLAIFSGEQAEHVSKIRELLDATADASPSTDDAPAVDDLLRRMHTLKGAARAVGLEQTELLTHHAEDVLTHVRQGATGFTGPVRRALAQAVDAIEDILAAAVANRTPPDVTAALRALEQATGREAKDGQAPAGGPGAKPVIKPDVKPDASPNPGPAAAPELVRVNTASLDALIRDSAELLVSASGEAVETRAGAHAGRLDEVAKEWKRLREACAAGARKLERDPELQQLAECFSFIDDQLTVLSREAHEAAASSRNGKRALHERAARVYQSACRVRMTVADVLLGGFGPMVRDLAQHEGKQISFHAEGLETNADLLVLQGLKDPVMHLLRNAVSHGVETPAERMRAGKAPEGTVWLRVRSRGDRLMLSIEDDGRGLNYESIAREARRRGLFQEGDSNPNPEEIAKLVFQPGFSTSGAITDVSGRGMGLSVVQRAMGRLHGDAGIYPGPEGGTHIFLSVPISISTQHVVLLAAAGQTFGVSASFVERLCRVLPSGITNVNGRESILTDGGPVALLRLEDLPGANRQPDHQTGASEDAAGIACAILTLNGRRAAIAADRLIDEREAIIKDSGLPPRAARLTAGAVPLEDGSVAVMLNVNGLFEHAGRTAHAPPGADARAKPKPRKARILVVDDSLTTRSLEKSILEAHGYQVQLAVDGLEALERLRAETPDLVISDVMMPRLSGFQLLEKMKSDEAARNIPVILVTSLESREEQQMGLSLGADAYIVKRKFDQRELLDVVRQIL